MSRLAAGCLLGFLSLYEGCVTTACTYDYINGGVPHERYDNYVALGFAPVVGFLSGLAIYKVGSFILTRGDD